MKSLKIALMIAIAATAAGSASAQSNTMGGMSGMSQGSMGNMKMPAKKTTATRTRTTANHKMAKSHGHGKRHHSAK